MQYLCALIKRVVPIPATVLILGESGVGKEVAARVLHQIACSPSPRSQIGSGSLPVDRLPSAGLVCRPLRKGGTLNRLEKALRALPVPVIGRIADNALWLDLRCLRGADEADFAAQCKTLS
ncbi:sigma 54-interacting transcriptional regulator [Pseudothauera lacus]|uniref:sigma 54-interacting transcriptional regulator n=1 Tax=Pseudothauera lacus TaxID=2136175 RepID=UPI002E26F7F1|nr:sigma 54-interacting transcriptional regulator [Pseudothauera lacus]